MQDVSELVSDVVGAESSAVAGRTSGCDVWIGYIDQAGDAPVGGLDDELAVGIAQCFGECGVGTPVVVNRGSTGSAPSISLSGKRPGALRTFSRLPTHVSFAHEHESGGRDTSKCGEDEHVGDWRCRSASAGVWQADDGWIGRDGWGDGRGSRGGSVVDGDGDDSGVGCIADARAVGEGVVIDDCGSAYGSRVVEGVGEGARCGIEGDGSELWCGDESEGSRIGTGGVIGE